MNTAKLSKILQALVGVFVVVLIVNCSSDNDSGGGQTTPTPVITVSGGIDPFGAVDALSHSDSQNVQVSASDLTASLLIKATSNFMVSLDDSTFSDQISITHSDANASSIDVYVRFSPAASAVGVLSGTLSFESSQAVTRNVNLSGESVSITPVLNIDGAIVDFEDVTINQNSISQSVIINGDNLESEINITTTGEFQVSLDDVTFSDSAQVVAASANDDVTVYVRFSPTVLGSAVGVLTFANDEIGSETISLTGNGAAFRYNYVTFDHERLAFGGSYNQSSTQTFNLHDDLSNIEAVKMYVKLACPTGGCDEWDVYANVKVLDPDSGEMYELGRYITPYWNDNSQLARGFEFDVTDFKSLLTGSVELRIRTECWNDKGYEVTVDFDYVEGTPDYPYYAVSRVIAYDDWSSSGVPYGLPHSFDLNKSVAIPANSESTHLRTIISGWGHATPNDSDGRGCAEWCYRTHDVKINGANMFQHDLGPLGCASNPVSNQAPGNWRPDRAGWCPGMVVPARTDMFGSSMAGSTFTFEYDYEDWVNDEGNGNAYYATSTFVVVKSNTPIMKPNVME